MDLVAEMLLKHLTIDYCDQITAAAFARPAPRFTGASNESLSISMRIV